ncbi:beta-carotene isomerase D27 [Pyrus ussuriensis x Pyrus communis]|uniref:Beta-carotene isomerase D27 n=1 Tax=Pyrus ussuriensis x Pyrus communis TaxID=2448454 RepID=A0A5N5HZE7_9ROSA|nr:beta-carotene isomerase D27 [Pyrus ussuriensis x Pyrus communis]
MVVLSLQPVQFTTPKHLSSCKPSVCGCSVRYRISEPSGEPAPMGQKTMYNDGFFERGFMTLFARKMMKSAAPSFVDVSKRVMQGRSRSQQQKVVREVLLSMLRKLFPPTKWAAEFNAALTVPFFHWLVGPCEVEELEINGVKQSSGVHIKKCRYLENNGCVGMCVNMCKFPTQDFFTNEFGLSLTMIPNMSDFLWIAVSELAADFEDRSCEMVYGEVPPPFEEDPVSKKPCLLIHVSSIANPSSSVCPKLQN